MLVWTENLAIGIVEIDNQHKELLDRANLFFDAVNENIGEAELTLLFEYFERYIMEHFSTEERYMDKPYMRFYTAYDEHKAAHRAFKRDLLEFKNGFETTGAQLQLISEFKQWLNNWWYIHITKMDGGFGAFLKEMLPPVNLGGHPVKSDECPAVRQGPPGKLKDEP